MENVHSNGLICEEQIDLGVSDRLILIVERWIADEWNSEFYSVHGLRPSFSCDVIIRAFHPTPNIGQGVG
jgi:hypothetical protein